MINAEPFLRWAGGKIRLINRLLPLVPLDYKKRRYWEPFLGAGSMFFSLCPPRAVLSDLNVHLIHCYEMVRDNPDLVHSYLLKHRACTSESYYYEVREKYNRSLHNYTTAQAARFIYLNKTCFNGIFRVNQKGEFNVPYGRIEYPVLPARNVLHSISKSLEKAKLYAAPYGEVLKGTRKGDFMYLDPPYPPLNKATAKFTHYTKERFDIHDQKKLAEIAFKLHEIGCYVMISNSDIREIRMMYKGWLIIPLPVTRWVTCKKTKHKVSEIVILNYKVPK